MPCRLHARMILWVHSTRMRLRTSMTGNDYDLSGYFINLEMFANSWKPFLLTQNHPGSYQSASEYKPLPEMTCMQELIRHFYPFRHFRRGITPRLCVVFNMRRCLLPLVTYCPELCILACDGIIVYSRKVGSISPLQRYKL